MVKINKKILIVEDDEDFLYILKKRFDIGDQIFCPGKQGSWVARFNKTLCYQSSRRFDKRFEEAQEWEDGGRQSLFF